MRLIGVVAAVALSVCFLSPGSAQVPSSQVQVVQVSNFPQSAATQQMSQWCWAAALESVFSYYGVQRSQSDIVVATYGTLQNFPAMSPFQLYGILNSASFSSTGQLSVTVGNFGRGAPMPTFLLSELQSGHPVVSWYLNGGGSGHAVVIFGAAFIPTAAGPLVTQIQFWDPWPGNGVQVVPAVQLASAMAYYFVIRSVNDQKNSLPTRRHSGDSCQFANDGECDEPNVCAEGTDATDCGTLRSYRRSAPAPQTTARRSDDSCQFANDGECDEPSACPVGTDATDCGSSRSYRRPALAPRTITRGADDSCQFANDGECDEPNACAAGTDATDCGARVSPSVSRPPFRPLRSRTAPAHWCCTSIGTFGPYQPDDVPVGAACHWPVYGGVATGVACNP